MGTKLHSALALYRGGHEELQAKGWSLEIPCSTVGLLYHNVDVGPNYLRFYRYYLLHGLQMLSETKMSPANKIDWAS